MSFPGRTVLALLVTLSGVACGPSVLWSGRSPDRTRVVRIVTAPGGQRVDVDGSPGPEVDGVGHEALTFSRDSRHFAYPATHEGKWFVVRDGRPGAKWDGIGEVVFSPDGEHLAYLAEQDGAWFVVRDERRVGGSVPSVRRGTLRFDPGSERLAWVASDGVAVWLVVDGEPGLRHGGIASLVFSPDGAHLAHLARDGRIARAVVDGVAGPPYDEIGKLGIRPKSTRFTYIGRHGKKWHAVIDGVEGPPFDDVGAPVFSRDGDHVGYAARAGDTFLVVRDGASGPAWLSVEPASLVFDASGELLYTARARDGWAVVAGRLRGPPFLRIEGPVVSDDGSSWGYIGHRRDEAHVFIAGRKLATEEAASDLILNAVGGHHAYLAWRDGARVVVKDGRAHPFDRVLEGSLVLSADGRHFACIAGVRRGRRFFYAIDGTPLVPFDITELLHEIGRGPGAPGGEGRDPIRSRVAAELALAADRRGSDGSAEP